MAEDVRPDPSTPAPGDVRRESGVAPFSVLVVDDEETYATSLKRLLMRRGVQTELAPTFEKAVVASRTQPFDLVVLDYMLPDGNGLDLIPVFSALRPQPVILMMTAYGTIENAVEAMRRGAYDYMTKSTELKVIVDKVADIEKVRRSSVRGREDGAGDSGWKGLMGESAAIKEVRQRLTDVAHAKGTTVLLIGESGTGKTMAARAIHALSENQSEPFVSIDCVALPTAQAETELFGCEAGFGGAPEARLGRLELARQGTVLLDEVGDLDPVIQGKLLGVLEERAFERAGGVTATAMQARVVAATHHDLGALVESGKFRLDLYHRLSVFPIVLPPLRARGRDVLMLANHFVEDFARRMDKAVAPIDDSSEVARLLCAYAFPGNVRELKNVIERAVILATNGAVTAALLPERIRDASATTEPMTMRLPEAKGGGLALEFRPGTDTLDDFERRLVMDALERAQGKKSRAAEILGISRFALMRRLEKWSGDV